MSKKNRENLAGGETDITERKKVEEALRTSESKYRTLLENLPQKIFFKDKNLIYVSCNENYARDLKILPNEITGKTDYDFFPKGLAEKYRADDKRIMQTGKTEDLEEEYLQEGQAVFVHTVKTPIKDEKGNTIGVLGIFWDITERKKAEETLRESEQRYRALFEGTAEGILVADIQTKEFKYANPAICRILGYTEDELKRMSVADIHPREKLEYVISEFEAQARGEKTLCENLPCLRKDGNIIYVDVSSAKVSMNGKECSVGFFTDISERRKAEEELRENEEYLKILLDSIHAGIIAIDPETHTIVDANSYAVEMIGESKEELVGRICHNFVCPAEVGKCPITDLWQEVDSSERVLLNINKDEIPILKSVVPITRKGKGYLIESFIDISNLRRAEEALRESEKKYRLLIENQGEGIATADLEENFIFANPSAEKIFGVPEGGLVGRNFKDFTSSEQFEFIREQTKRRHTGEKGSYEIEIITAKGERRYLLLTAAPWFDKDGVLTATFGIIRDITERKQLQQQLIRTEKLAAVGTLAYGIAHEFNNILAGMLANAELGLITDELEQIKKCFKVIADNSYRASSITRNLLAFSRNQEAKKELIDVTEPLKSVLAITRRELEKLNIHIVENFKPLPKICCDAGQLSEVFLNMVTNARDAMREKGGKLIIQAEPVGENIQIIFQDTGCGIPEKIKGKIFEPFVTTKGALGKGDIPGTGLGLFLSYGIIDGYKGKIEVASEVGKGTRFTLSIPVSKNLPCGSIRHTEMESSGESEGKLKILLVDDEKAISFGLKKFLESRGHKVRAFLKAKEGLEHIRKDRFDLVLSDIAMPDMDGIELIKTIKDENKDTKVIAITGHILKEKENKAREAGADEVLVKPFKNELLCSTISRLIRSSQINNNSLSK